MGRVWIRLYTLPASPDTREHAFYVGNDITNTRGGGGLSRRLTTVVVPDETTTFTDLRQMLEYEEDRGMFRRTSFYTNLLRVLDGCLNPHGYSDANRRKFVFGTIKGIGSGNEDGKTEATANKVQLDEFPDSNKPKKAFTGCEKGIPAIIRQEVEDEPIAEIIGDLMKLDLILVPCTQIRPSDGKVTAELEGER